jgi:pyroglutamyl-peptidase
MSVTVLITGFGPFPGASFNPTGALAEILARPPRVQAGTRRIAHVFITSYDTVDRELPALITRERPAALVMFGLAQRTRHVRIETLARNTLSRVHADVAGIRPNANAIAADGPAMLALPAPAQRLLAAARAAGARAALSSDAGSYLCNYLCWRARERATSAGGPQVATFVHVPQVRPLLTTTAGATPRTLGDLIQAGEAIVAAATVAARIRRWPKATCSSGHESQSFIAPTLGSVAARQS